MNLVQAIQELLKGSNYKSAQISAPVRIIGETEDGWAEKEQTGVKVVTLVE